MLFEIQTRIHLPTIDEIAKTICQNLSQLIDKLIFYHFLKYTFGAPCTSVLTVSWLEKLLNSLHIFYTYIINPIAYGVGGGRGLLSHTTRLLAATLKPLKLWLPNFVTSCFYLFATILHIYD